MNRKLYISTLLNNIRTIVALFVAVSGVAFSANGQGNCPPVGLPLEENFNTTDSLPTCWERWENFDEPAMKAHIVSAPTTEGIGALMISCGSTQSTVHRTVVRARKLSQPANGIRMSVKLRASQMGTGESAVIAVGVCNSNSSNYMTNFEFDTVQIISITTSNTWNTYDIDFSSYTGSGDRLAFLMSQPMQTGTAHKIYIDEMIVERCTVSDLWVSHRASDELTLHWTSSGQGTANLTATPHGGGSTLSFNGVSSPYRITGLSAATTYTLTLTPQCDNEALPGMSHSMNGTTLAGPHLGLMYCESFEGNTLPTGWTALGGATMTTSPRYSGSSAIKITSGDQRVVLPMIALVDGTMVNIGDLMFSTMMYASSASSRLQLCVTNYPEEDSEMIPFDTITPTSIGSWSQVLHLLSRYSGTARYLVLRTIGGGAITLDDFNIGRCIVTGVGLANYTSTTATIEWDVPTWIGDVIIQSFDDNSVITVGSNDGTTVGGKRRYTITGLVPGNYYSYAVSGSCDVACNAETVNFNTFTQEYPLPYCTEFEMTGTMPTDWNAAMSYNSCPRLDNGQHHSGSRALKMSAGGSVGNGNYSLAVLPPLIANGSIVVSFAAYGATSGCIVEIGTVDNSGTAASFVSSGQIAVANGQWERYAVNIPGIGGSERIALRYSHTGSGERLSWIDDLEVSRCGVSGVNAYDERANGATIAWNSGCDSVDIQYRKRGTAATQTVENTTSPLVLNDLDQGSTYDYYIRCTEDGLTGCWIYGGFFITNAGALTADYCHNGAVSLTSTATLWNLPYLEENNYTGLMVSFDVSGSGTMQVGLMTAEGNAASYTALSSTITVNSTTTRHSVLLTGHEVHGHYIALKRLSGSQTIEKLRISRGGITTFAVSNVTATTATITWSTEGVVDSVAVVYQGGGQSGEVRVNGVNTVTLTGLTAGTNYTFSLTAINNLAAQNCAVDEGTFITLGADITDGWCENFNSVSTGTLPVGWTAVTGQPVVYSYNGSNRLKMSSTSSSSAMVALPTAVVDFHQTPLKLRVEVVCVSGTPEQSSLVAGIMTDAGNAASFTAISTIHPSAATQTYILDLSGYSGSGRIVALRYDSPSASRTIYVDNLALANDIVAGITVTEVTDHSVRINWEGSSNVIIHWSGGDTTATGHSCTIDGLNSGTTYSFNIVANGQWTSVNCQQLNITARTLEEATIAPMCNGFEAIDAATSLPYGWSRVSNTNYPTYTTSIYYDGNRSLMFYTTSGNSTMAVSPLFEQTNLSENYISFYAYSSGTGSLLQVGTMNDPGDASSFVARAELTIETGNWRRYEVSLAGAPSSHRYVALRHSTTSGSRYLYLDKLMVQSCPMPTSLSIENPQTNSMEVTWSGGGTVKIEWYRTGYSSGHQITTATGGNYTITGLTANTDYTVEIWSLCGNESEFSCHKLTATQQTLPLPSAIPYCQSFSGSSLPTNWHTHTVGGSVSSISGGYTGRAVQLNLGSGGDCFTSVTIPQLDTAGICPDLQNIQLEFQVMGSGNAILQIGTMQNLNDSSDFTPFYNINLSSISSSSWTNQSIAVPTSLITTGFITLRLIHASGGTGTAWVRIDELCMRYCTVSNVTLTSITPTTATFTWNQNNNVDGLWVYWSGGSYYATTSPFTITGLNPNQTYNFTFTPQCNCDITGTSYSGSYTSGSSSQSGTQMPASPMGEFPTCYNFDNYNNSAFPAEWRRSSTTYPRVYNTRAFSGTRSLDFYATSGNSVTMAMQPLPVGCTHAVIGFQVYCTNADAANGGRLQIGLLSSPDDFSSFTPIGSVAIEALDTWQRHYIDIDNPATPYVGLRFAPSASYHIYIDDLGFTECAITSLSAEGGILSATTLGTPSSYTITVTNIDDGTTRQLTTSQLPLSFSPDSNYTFSVTAICQSAPTCTPATASYGYRIVIPYCEEFDGQGLHPEGWHVVQRNSATYPRQQSSGTDSTFYRFQATTGGCIVALPLLPVGRTLGGLHVWLQVKLGSSSDIGNTLVELGSIDDNGIFTVLTTLQNTSQLQSHNVTLPPCNGTRLAIRTYSTSGTRNLYLDHLQITDYARPNALRYTKTSNHLQHIYWDNTADNSHYVAEWGPVNFTPGNGTLVASDSCHLLIAPTAANTTYQLYLYDTAAIRFCTPYRFSTLPASTSLPYCISGRSLSSGTMLYLPEIDLPVNTTTLLLTWRTAAAGRLVIGVLSEYQTPSTFIPVDTLYPDAPNTLQRSAIDLYNYADTGRFVALRFEGAAGYISQLTLQSVPQPTFHVLNSSSIEATLPNGYPSDYYLRVVPQGQSQSSTTAQHVDSLHYVITGLSPYTDYDIYVLADGIGTTCAPPVTLRTHLDITAPHCTDLSSQHDGWYYSGCYRVMPYVLIDSLDSLHLYFTSRGSVTVGLQSALDDTTSFVPLTTFSSSTFTDQTLHFNQLTNNQSALTTHHYITFRYESSDAAVSTLEVLLVPKPSFHVLSSSEIEVTTPDGQTPDYWLELCPQSQSQCGGTMYHVQTSPYVISGLDMYTYYNIFVLHNSTATTCAPPTLLRTHLDIEAPYCESYTNESDGWYITGSHRTMPRLIIDTMGDVYVTFVSRGAVSVGVQPTLDDPSAFVPLASVQSSVFEEHVVHLSDYVQLVGNHHYIAFNGGELQTVYLHTCPIPTLQLTAYNEATFTQQEDSIEYWIKITTSAGDSSIVHATGEARSITVSGLTQNTYYNFSYLCDSASTTCIPPVTILSGVRISAPYCANLGGIAFGSINTGNSTSDGTGGLPAGWRSLTGEGGSRYYVLPIIDIDSIDRIYARFSYRIAQTGSALSIGIMTDPVDPATFSPLATVSESASTFSSYTLSFANYTDTGLYIAFRSSGNAPSQVYLDSVALQTVPFVEYHLTSHNSVKVLPVGQSSFTRSISYIAYSTGSQTTILRADTLPWLVTELDDDAIYQFSLRADSLVNSCYPPTEVATTHLAPTPLCNLTAMLSGTSPLWRGPELTEANLSNLWLRLTATTNRNGLRIVVGTLRVRNIDSTFCPIDTITLTSTSATIYSTSLISQINEGRFLAFMLLPVATTDNVSLTNITLDHCLTPLTAHLELVRHNIVRFDCNNGETIDWLEYGPSGFLPGNGTTIRVTSLPLVLTLNNSTTYDFYMLCDSGAATCATPLSITTLPAPPPLGWCEPFDSQTIGSLPSGWRSPSNMTSAQEAKVVNNRSHTTSRSLYMNSTIGHSTVTILPDLGLDSLNNLAISLWLNSSNPTTSRLQVGVIFNTSDPESFYPLQTLTVSSANTWQRHLVDLRDAPAGAWFIAFRCEGYDGLNRLWVDDIHISECGANSFTVAQVEAEQVTLRWRQTGNPVVTLNVIPNDGTPWTVNVTNTDAFGSWSYFTVTGLSPLTNYRFAFNAICDQTTGYCTTNYTDTVRVFTPAGGTGCIDPTNLAAAYTSCFYGTYNNPYANNGVLDYGYSSALSRHTVHYNLDERDPRTGNILATIPEGAVASVRLGNWTFNSTSPEAESLVYGLSVDTMNFDLLIMRYAAVLQDPDHAVSDQPRFSLELLNSNMQVIDSVCARADFVANWQMGWNFAANSVLWKDWTTVGIDMAPYAGQTVYIRLTTRDCNEGSHYGYAYFTLECMRKNITTTECGIVSQNVLTAPSGFNYRWYTSANDNTISTAQSITVPSNNYITYLCDNAFVDNPGCYFTMSAFAGVRFPLALMNYDIQLGTCSFDVTFHNNSTISSDGVTPVGTGEGVESARWFFGDGDSSTSYNTSHHYSSDGTYNVALICGIAGDRCLDTMTVPIILNFPPTELEITGPTERCFNASADTLRLRNVVRLLSSSTGLLLEDSVDIGTHRMYNYIWVVDQNHYSVGSHLFTAVAIDSVGCTVSLSHTVVVHPTYDISDTRHICTLLLPYTWRDTAFATGTTSGLYTIHRYSEYGCDSVMHVNLNVYDNATYTKRDTTMAAVCDNQSYFFSDSLLTPNPALTHNGVYSTIYYTDSLYSSIGCDSLSTVVLTVHPTYDHHLIDTACSNQSYTWGTPLRNIFQTWSNESYHHGSDTLTAMAVAAVDTLFTDSLQSTNLCDSISSLHLRLLPAYTLHYNDTICSSAWSVSGGQWPVISGHWVENSYRFEDSTYTVTGDYTHELATGGMCDSTRTLHLKVYPTYDIDLYDTIYDGDRYAFESNEYTATGTYSHLLAAQYACDSLRRLHLQCNKRTYIDSVVCQNLLPLTWSHLRISDTAGTVADTLASLFQEGSGVRGESCQIIRDSVHLLGQWDVDSLVVMTLIVRDTAATYNPVHSCDSMVWEHTPDTIYRQTTSAPLRYLTQLSPFDTTGIGPLVPREELSVFHRSLSSFGIQCDSVRHLTLKVDYTHFSTDRLLNCDSLQWRHGEWFYRDTLSAIGPVGSHLVTGPVDTLVTAGGCDSVIGLHLIIRYSTYEEAIDTFCWHETYTWRGQLAGDTDPEHWQAATEHQHYYLTDTLATHLWIHPADATVAKHCDSVMAISLTQMAKPMLQLSDSIHCAEGNYALLLKTNVPYSRFEIPDSGYAVNFPGNPFPTTGLYSHTVFPSEPYSTYTAYVDYHEQPLCPVTAEIKLRPVVVPQANFRYSPGALRYNDMDFDAYDLTIVAPRSIHPGDPEVWRRRWYTDDIMLTDTSYHLTDEIILANLPVEERDTLRLALEVFNGQCYDTIVKLLPILRVAIFAPTAFTPTEETNNRFVISTQGIIDAELSIYNREGLLVYRTHDLSVGWDGRRSDGVPCLQANYVWKLIYHSIDHPEATQDMVGTVLLIR